MKQDPTLVTNRPVLLDCVAEMRRARSKHKPLRSPHEAIAVIREEYLEAEREVYMRVVDRSALREELIQLAAVTLRAVEDLGLNRSY